MLRIKNHGKIFVPARTAGAANATLLVGGASNLCRVTSNARHGDANTFSRAHRQRPINHVGRKPNVEVIRERAMLSLVFRDDGIFPSREPMANVGSHAANVRDSFQMFKGLNVAAIMPAKDIDACVID